MRSKYWSISTLEKEGMDPQKINELIDFIIKENKPVHSLIIVKNGKLVTDVSFNGYNSENIHEIYSCSKSVNSALVGIAINDGLIKNVNQKVLEFFPEIIIPKYNLEIKNMTIENLLTMTTGLQWEDIYNYDKLWDSKNPIEYFFNLPMESLPGTKFCYCSGVPHILQFLLERATGEDLLSYAKRKLFNPIGIERVEWPKDNNGLRGSIEISPLDMAKFGYLFLKKGMWNEVEIILKQWVEISIAKYVETPNNINEVTNFGAGYGYQWWRNHFGGFHANGFGGQYIFVVPKLDLVVVFTGELFGEDFFMPQIAMQKYVISAMK
jgi:CubicO group peptidase (beta-lactamase class C family)